MSLNQRYQQVLSRIATAESKSQASAHPVTLLAVSKTHSTNKINELYQLGQRHFGENYLQEAEQKIADLAQLDIIWHYIGPIQSNKTRAIAHNFDWVQTIDREKIAKRLSKQRPNALTPLNVCIQVNISNEPNKSGIEPQALMTLAQTIEQLPNLKLRGIMCIPKKTDDRQLLTEQFNSMNHLFGQLKSLYSSVDCLSMGMSGDLELAITQGSTMVRVGTDIFGKRIAPLMKD
jgi:PLP dependent protein